MIQKDLIDIVTKEWIDFFWNNIGKEVDKKAFEEGIKWLYEDIYKKPVPKIIYCNSPKEALILFKAGLYIQSTFLELNLEPTLLFPQESDHYDIRVEIDTKILNRTFIRLDAIDHLLDDIKCYRDYSLGCEFYSKIACLDYYNKIGLLNSPHFINYRNLVKSGAFQTYLTEENIYVFNFPIEVQIENGSLHSIKARAIKFRNGDEYYFIRGVEIKERIFKKVQNRSITLEEILGITNEEVKSAVLLMYQELYGEEATYHLISESLKEIDSCTHKTGTKTLCYTLFKGRLGIHEVAYVRCYCPSTDRMFFLGVSSDCRQAKNAIASLYRIPRKLERHIKYINRQGERFTTVLTEIGEEVRKTMTKSDFQNLTTISGDDYFLFMRYEY